MTLASPPPPRLDHLPAGTRLVAGLGYATVLPDMDFETYSEAGFDWNEGLQKWVALPGASGNKKGLGIVGAAVYAEHPSTEVLSLYYDLKDGRGRRHWRPGMLPPIDLFLYVRNGGLIEAWNKGFETWIWEKVCVPKLGWPPIPMSQMRCAMAKARAFGLPGKLEKTGEVLQLENQKLKDGDRLLKKFSVPRQPTAKNRSKRLFPHEDPVDGPLFYGYNERDIVAEAEASSRIPDLTGEELEFWQADMDINHRGVQIDIDSVENCIAIIDQAHNRYNTELATLTSGDVMRASELAKLQAWFSKYGFHFASLDEENIDAALSRTDLPAWARRALEIRQAIGSAAVKKVYAMRLQATRAGRLHDLFSYHAAHTGRVTGNGPQPTNLPNSGPAVLKCGCGHYFGKQHLVCPWCAKPLSPVQETEEWSWRAATDALTVISSRSLDMVEYYFGDAMGAISGVLRGLFVAAEGHDLMCSDYASIEAVVLAEVAGEQWRREVFRTHGKIYEAGAAAVTGIPFSDFMKAAGYTDAELAAPDWYKRPPATPTDKHHPMRKKIGKISELACFSPDTQVLTERGYVAIVDVLATDKLWDGVEWVSHAGVIPKGLQQVLNLDGVRMTPSHPINTGRSWLAASRVVSNESILSQCLANGSANLPSIALNWATEGAWPNFGLSAVAVLTRIKSILQICAGVQLLGVIRAQKLPLLKGLKSFGLMRTSSPISATVVGCLTEFRPPLVDVTIQKTRDSTITVRAASKCGQRGALIKKSFYVTSLRLKGGITLISKWIENALTMGMNRAIYGLLLDKKTCVINGVSQKCNKESTNWSPVYDIVNAGPRHRFTIRTNNGHLIVHNSGYQGWIGSWKAFGADEFMTDDEMKKAILAWRAASPAIVEFWGGQERRLPSGRRVAEMYGVEGMFISAVLNPGIEYEFRGFKFLYRGDAVHLRLLSGRTLTYHRPRLRPSDRGGLAISYEGWNTNPKNGPTGWIRKDTWGGRLTENIVQAVARDILRYAILNLERAGYPVVLHVYDEIVAEVRKEYGSMEEFERIMATMPEWAIGWPIKAMGGWRGPRYRK